MFRNFLALLLSQFSRLATRFFPFFSSSVSVSLTFWFRISDISLSLSSILTGLARGNAGIESLRRLGELHFDDNGKISSSIFSFSICFASGDGGLGS